MVTTVGNLVSPLTHQDYLSCKQATPEIENDLLSLGQVGLRKVHTLANDELSTKGGTDYYAQDSPQNQVFGYIHQNIKKLTVKTNVQQETTVTDHLLTNTILEQENLGKSSNFSQQIGQHKNGSEHR